MDGPFFFLPQASKHASSRVLWHRTSISRILLDVMVSWRLAELHRGIILFGPQSSIKNSAWWFSRRAKHSRSSVSWLHRHNKLLNTLISTMPCATHTRHPKAMSGQYYDYIYLKTTPLRRYTHYYIQSSGCIGRASLPGSHPDIHVCVYHTKSPEING